MRWVKEAGAENIVTIYGNSGDEKPVAGISDGSVFVETDTQKVFLFDETNKTWRLVGC